MTFTPSFSFEYDGLLLCSTLAETQQEQMDIPLSSTALDLALHPSPDNDLLVVGLISGKVELLNLSEQSGDGEQVGKKQRLKKKQKRIQEPDDEDDEDDAESSADGSRSYAKKWSTRYKSKSCRGVEFNWGE